MRRPLLLACGIFLGVALFPAAAEAGWGVSFGVGSRGVYVHGSVGHHRRLPPRRAIVRHHRHVRVPIYSRVWVPPVYERVVVGHTFRGRPIVRTVLVRAGYYKRVIVGYRCRRCRAILR